MNTPNDPRLFADAEDREPDDNSWNLRERAMPAIEHYWHVAYNQKWLILAIIVASLIIGAIATLLATPQYVATSRIEISRAESNITNVDQLQTEDARRDIQYFETQYELLEARSLAERVASSLDLANDERFQQAFDLAAPAAEAATDPNTLRRTSNILLSRVAISPVSRSSLVDIGFKSPDPVLSAQIANAWATEFIAASLDRRLEATGAANDFLRERLDEWEARLQRSRTRLLDHVSSSGVVTLSPAETTEGNSGTSRTLIELELQALSSELAEATAERIAAQANASAGNGTVPADVSNSAIAQLQSQRALAAAELAELSSQLGPEHPRVMAATDQLASIDRSISGEYSRVSSNTATERSGNLRRNLRSAREREARLRQRVNELTQRFLRQRRGAIQYDILEQEVDTNAELVEALSRRAGEIDAAGIGRSNIAVVDRAERPGGPSEPSMVFNLMTSLFIGVLASAGIVFLREQLDTGIRDPADVKRVLGLPLLGSIPRVEDGDVLGELNNRWSHLYESYLAVQTNLTFATPDGAPRTMLLTSTRPNEGKTASAVALAAVFSKLGKKTLLIDADMRNSRLGDFLGMTQQDGLSNLLSSDQPVNELIYSPENHGFDLILSGRTPPNAAELLAGNRFPFLLRELAGHYDHVLIDGPPILGLADAPLIAKSTDAVIAIIEANGGSLRTIQTALARLDFAHVAILGAIVTKLDDRNAGYGYGEGYGYGYGYGKREEA